MNKEIKEKIKNIVKKAYPIILNWFKKEKLITFVLIIMLLHGIIYNVWQFGNEIKYGKFTVFKTLPSNTGIIASILQSPKTLGIGYFAPIALKIDDNDILFFIKDIKAERYCVYNLDLGKKKFKKYATEFGYSQIKFAKNIDNKIYLIFSKWHNDKKTGSEHIDNEKYSHIVIYDYKKDIIERTFELNDKISRSSINYNNPRIIKMNNKKFIVYPTYGKERYCRYKLYDIENNTVKHFKLRGINNKEDILLTQFKNGLLLFYREDEKKDGYYLYTFDLNSNKKLFEYKSDIKVNLMRFIFIGDDKYIITNHSRDSYDKTVINTFQVDKSGKITNIASTAILDKNCVIFPNRQFASDYNYVVLNPNSIIFIGGISFLGFWNFHSTKEAYIYHYQTNEIKRITDFKYNTSMFSFINLDNNSFLMYDIWTSSPLKAILNLNKVYKFKLKEGV